MFLKSYINTDSIIDPKLKMSQNTYFSLSLLEKHLLFNYDDLRIFFIVQQKAIVKMLLQNR